MSDLDEQFLLEARELLAQAGEDLLALEREAASPERIDSLFRSLHTLKGSAGIMDLPPLGHLMHAAEDLLGAWRSGAAAPSLPFVDWLLAALDRTEGWLGDFEAAGRLRDEATDEAAELNAELAALRGKAQPEPTTGPPDWAEALLESVDQAPKGPVLAVEYVPRARCFFDGDDPIDLLRRLPGLIALRMEAREPWPPLEEMDPFACNLRFRALVGGDLSEARALFRFVADQVRIAPVEVHLPFLPSPSPLEEIILVEQRRLLDHVALGEGAAGRLVSAARAAANVLRASGKAEEAARVEVAGRAAVEAGAPDLLRAALDTSGAQASTHGPAAPSAMSLRVDPARVDALADLVGELIVAKNALAHLAAQRGKAADATAVLRAVEDQIAGLDRLTSGLQRAVLDIRMMSVAPVFRRFPRVIRDVARTLGKEVALILSGEDTELDKTLVEMLSEPLLHLVRNALDHGIETPPERLAAGKPAQGRLELRAFRSGDGVAIEIQDDGQGIDAEALRRSAVVRGLLPPDEAAALSDEDALQLVFRPGLSTAPAVTDLSGRGVGMDVVRSAVEAVGGRVRLSSSPGRGTICRIELPASLLATRLLVIRVGEERYGLPMDQTAETLRLPQGLVRPVQGGSAFVLRDRTVPLVKAADLLGQFHGTAKGDPLVIVLASAQGLIGLVVDAIEERLDAVVKRPEGLVAALPHLLGTTLRGDGQVLLVLDPEGLLA